MQRAEPVSLAAIQAQLQRLIAAPDGVEAAPATGGDAGEVGLAELVRGDRGIAPAARVAVYASAFFARLHDCLREDFGALARALGPEGFHDLVKTYLMACPPRDPSLRLAGSRLAEHLAAPPFAAIFSGRCAYAADLARLEWAIAEAFTAADAPSVSRDGLADVAPRDFERLRFLTAPSLQLLACDWPVHRVRERFDGEGEAAWDAAPELGAEPTWLLVFRQRERVRYRAILRSEHAALAAARDGECFAAICERLASELGAAAAAPRAAAWLAEWLDAGLIAGCS